MKKIEEQIIKTFEARCNDYLAREVVLSSRDSVEGYGNDIIIYRLDDRAIFRYETKEQRFSFTLAGNNTPTTRSRLRALLGYFCNVQLYMKQGKVYLADHGAKIEIAPNIWCKFKLKGD